MGGSTVATLGVADYTVLGATLFISAAVGLYYRLTGGKQKTVDEYILGERKQSVINVAFSLMASFMSAITLLGLSRENYMYGTQFYAINLAYGIATPIVSHIFLPVFYRLGSASAYSYLQERFGYTTRLLASLAFSLQMVLYMGIVVYAPALALSSVTDLSQTSSIMAVGIVCIFYSVLGGMKAVLVTDVFQSFLMFAAIIAVVISATISVGSIPEVFSRASEGGRLTFWNLDPDPSVRHTLWTQVVGGVFTYCSIYAVNQAQVQRLLTVATLRQSQLAVWIQWLIVSSLSSLTSYAGLALYAHYRDCDPLLDGRIDQSDQILPLFVVERMHHYPGLSGLFISGVFAGSLSTVSSAINSLAAVTLEDYLKPLTSSCNGLGAFIDKHATFILKLLALFYGVICIGLTFLGEVFGSGLLQAALTVFGLVGGPLLGLFTLGMSVPRANQTGALTGLIISLAFLSWMGFGGSKPPPIPLSLSDQGCQNDDSVARTNVTTVSLPQEDQVLGTQVPEKTYFYLYRISYAWYTAIGFFVVIIVGTLVSYASNIRSEVRNVKNPDLFFPPLRKRMIARRTKDEDCNYTSRKRDKELPSQSHSIHQFNIDDVHSIGKK